MFSKKTNGRTSDQPNVEVGQSEDSQTIQRFVSVNEGAGSGAWPKVALVVLCRNEEKYIGRCLDSMLANDYDQSLLDIVVVDGMSTDRTREIVGEYCKQYRNVRMIDNPKQITPAAFNMGIRATTAEVVMPIASHSVYPTDYISKLVAGLYRHEADNIGGLLEACVADRCWDRAVAVVCSHPFAAGNALHRTVSAGSPPRQVNTVFCGCYRRDVFSRIGYFNEKLIRGQDREFNDRLTQHGGKIILDPSVKCGYVPRTKLRSYAQWMLRGGFWVFNGQRFTKTRMVTWRNVVPPVFVLYHLVPLIVLAFSATAALVAASPIGVYWALNLLISAREAWAKRDLRYLPYLMTLFATTHYAYGIGALGAMFCRFLPSRKEES